MKDIGTILASWNPWWEDGTVPPELRGIPRDLADETGALLEAGEVLTLLGVRRSGKTTILYQMIDRLLSEGVGPENVLFMDFEDPRTTDLTVGDVIGAWRQHKDPRGTAYAFLDEVQASEGWERWVRLEHEQKRGTRFVVTGSSSTLVRGELARLLTGRTLTVNVQPLSFQEFLRFRNVDIGDMHGDVLADRAIHMLGEYIGTGGFPGVVLGDTSIRQRRLKEYFDTILYRDVVYRHGVDAGKVERLATYLLSNIGTLQYTRSLATATQLSTTAVESYLSHLEEAMLIVPVRALTFKTKPEVLSRLPTKYYCIDTGLRNAVAPRHSPDEGWLVENIVCLELVRRGERPLFWKNSGDVDFVTGSTPGALVPLGVCYSDEIPAREVASLHAFGKHVPRSVGGPVLITRSTSGTSDSIEYVPAWRWLLQG
jgi:predicted AAA+ superfamily ATPase